MRLAVIVLSLSMGVVLWAASAEAQTMKRGVLDGVVVTRSVAVPPLGSANVHTTPASTVKGAGFFILTQVCTTDRKDVVIIGDTMGEIILDGDCQTYDPGLAIPQGETLTCTDTADADQACMITGIQSKK